MRGLLVCAVVAALVAPVFGQHTGVISITTPGAVDMGTHNEIDIAALVAPWYVDIYASSTDTIGMGSFQVQLTGCDGMNYAASNTKAGLTRNYCGYYSYLSERAGQPDNGWDMGNGLSWVAGVMPAGPEVGSILAGEGYTVFYGQNGWAGWVKMLDLPAEPCTISGNTDTVSISDHNTATMPVTIKPLIITPEPASLLLLLAGLPLLRRRR